MTVIDVEVISEGPYADGQIFADGGQYVMRRLVLTHAFDPLSPANLTIVDLPLAPRDDDGLVRCQQDIVVLAPRDPERNNGRVLVDAVNRGRPTSPGLLNRDTTPPFPVPDEPHAGDGHLFRYGWTVVLAGWQFDIDHPKLLGLKAPMAVDGGTALRGQVVYSAMPPTDVGELKLGLPGHRPFAGVPGAPASMTETDDSGMGEAQIVPNSDWSFGGDGRSVIRAGGFRAGRRYEVVYTTEGATIGGCGLAALRDLAPWVRAEQGAESVVLLGVSQCGRMIRQMLHDGLNVDEAGQQAYDAVMPVIAGVRMGQFNRRFGNPGVLPIGDDGLGGPVTYAELLQASEATNSAPLVMALNTSAEYWRGDAHLVHQGSPPHSGVRVHHVAGTQHSAGLVPQMFADPYHGTRGRHGFGTVDYRPVARGLLQQLVDWIDGVEPADDTVPTADVLTSRESVLARFVEAGRDVPDVRSFGEPPGPVPDIGADLNELGGIRLPDIAVPIGIHAAWNLRHPDFGAPTHQLALTGSTVWHDDLPGLEHHLAAARSVAQELAQQRWIIASDIDVLVADADARWSEAAKG
ncbi:MAG: hypothetical protein ACI8Y4_004181 [Candidatus Poriferisodalaceae bacterium]|jgi:hypothetical protein